MSRVINSLSTCVLLFSVLACASGCRSVGLMSGGTKGEFVSDEQPFKLAPRFTSRLFDSQNPNSADIVLSDLDRATLMDRRAWAGAEGQVLHARMFIQPRAGRTPIQSTACSVTLRYIVLAGGEYGIYAGGGFLLPDGAPGEKNFSGRISNASMRLVSSTPGFLDLIGSGRMSLSFRVSRDGDAVRVATRNADFLAFGAEPSPDHPLLVNQD